MSFHSVPLNQPNRSKWIQAIELYQEFDYAIQTYHICSLHFLPTDIQKNGKRRTVISGKVPSIFTDINNSNIINKNNNEEIICVEEVNTVENICFQETLGVGNENWLFAENEFEIFDDETSASTLDQNQNTQ